MDTPARPCQNPRVATLRYRAYCHCAAHGTDYTITDLAEALDVPAANLRRAIRDEKWARVLRSTALDIPASPEFDGAAAYEAKEIAADFLRVPA